VNGSVIVAGMWDHVEVAGAVDPAAPPTQADLDAIADRLTAENCGARPVVRTVEELTIPAFVVDDPGPTCEELHEDGWRRYVRR
jgi:hypothetical protein